MTDKKQHLYTLHRTYTGHGCAICGLPSDQHSSFLWLVDGKEIHPDAGQPQTIDELLQLEKEGKAWKL